MNLTRGENSSFTESERRKEILPLEYIVLCTNCKQLLRVPTNIPVYRCGCCGSMNLMRGENSSFTESGRRKEILPLPLEYIVLCTNCKQLLRVPTNIPVYRCGCCGAVLRAKRKAQRKAKDIVVGFDEEAQAIIDQLQSGSMKLDIVSIVGMPGIGKTTLAKKVYSDFSVIHHFHVRAWASISQQYSKKDVFLDILNDIVPENSDRDYVKNEDDLAERLYKCLKGKRYLIVLDDVWDIHAWNALERSFPNDANGSRIILTSRCLLLSKTHYTLRGRTDDECWELLQKKLDYKVDTSLLNVGRQIAKSCRGLPLAVVLVAGILANVKLHAWEAFASSLSSSILFKTKDCMNILELSYIHLPDHLKPCFLYFAAFPEDQEISIKRLMWLWIAEGFVQKNELKVIEDAAEDYVMSLISRNLVTVAKQSSIGKIKTCRIHDLLLEFCRVKSREENFLQSMRGHDGENKKSGGENPYRLSIYSQPEDFVRLRPMSPQTCTLIFFPQGVGGTETSYSLSFLFHLKLLTVLDLGQMNIGSVFPTEIAVLVQLRYLGVLGSMNAIPSSIDRLSNLETLLLIINTKSLDGLLLPNTLWNMHKLRHVHVRGCLVDLNFAEDDIGSSSGLDDLVTFSTLRLHLNQNIEKIIGKFPNISKLKCNLLDSEKFLEDGSNSKIMVRFPSRLESLKLILCNVTVLHSVFNFPSNLKKLTLSGFSWSMISSICKLPNLEVLKLLNRSTDGVDKWEMEEEEFLSLRFLKLGCSDIVKWAGSGDHFPHLQILELEGCKDLKELPLCLGTISTLHMIRVHKCPETVKVLVRGIEDEQKYWGNENLEIDISEELEKM